MSAAPITDPAAFRLPVQMYRAWHLGADAADTGLPPTANPFPPNARELHAAWVIGYGAAPFGCVDLLPSPRRPYAPPPA